MNKKKKLHLNTSIYFNIAAINKCTSAEGPYKRMAIWFQGCNLHCKNCCNPSFQKFEKRNLISLQAIIDEVLIAKKQFNIEGITLTGGEPTLQSKNLPLLCKEIKKIGLGIILFTGRLYKDLSIELIHNIDIIIDGQFIDNKQSFERKYIGSKNQNIYYITDRYSYNLFNQKQYSIVNINIEKSIFINGDVELNKF